MRSKAAFGIAVLVLAAGVYAVASGAAPAGSTVERTTPSKHGARSRTSAPRTAAAPATCTPHSSR